MAEQAINTIYLLGEQPDALCATLIRQFTIRVFSAPPTEPEPEPAPAPAPADDAMDTSPDGAEGADESSAQDKTAGEVPAQAKGNSFQLSQLLFLVGHVAIKHIVYLEQVERDLKRRKDDASKGARILDAHHLRLT